jgi:hypothetical protein
MRLDDMIQWWVLEVSFESDQISHLFAADNTNARKPP